MKGWWRKFWERNRSARDADSLPVDLGELADVGLPVLWLAGLDWWEHPLFRDIAKVHPEGLLRSFVHAAHHPLRSSDVEAAFAGTLLIIRAWLLGEIGAVVAEEDRHAALVGALQLFGVPVYVLKKAGIRAVRLVAGDPDRGVAQWDLDLRRWRRAL